METPETHDIPLLRYGDGASVTSLIHVVTHRTLPRYEKKRILSFLTLQENPSLDLHIEQLDEPTQNLCTLLASPELRNLSTPVQAIRAKICQANTLLEQGASLAMALKHVLPFFWQVQECRTPFSLANIHQQELASYAYQNPQHFNDMYLLSFLVNQEPEKQTMRSSAPKSAERAAQIDSFYDTFFDCTPLAFLIDHACELSAHALQTVITAYDQEIVLRMAHTPQKAPSKQMWLNTLLLRTTLKQEADKIAVLLDHGAEPVCMYTRNTSELDNAIPQLCSIRTDNNGYRQTLCPLHIAAYRGDERIARLFCLALAQQPEYKDLLQMPLDPAAGLPYGGRTALEIAHEKNHPKICRLLAQALYKTFELQETTPP
jgi:hypothetical protein